MKAVLEAEGILKDGGGSRGLLETQSLGDQRNVPCSWGHHLAAEMQGGGGRLVVSVSTALVCKIKEQQLPQAGAGARSDTCFWKNNN